MITLNSLLLNKCDIVHFLLFKGCALKCNNWPVNIRMSLQSIEQEQKNLFELKKKVFFTHISIYLVGRRADILYFTNPVFYVTIFS